MANVRRVGDLEVSQDLAFQRRVWRFERVGWVLLGLCIVAALLGLTGSGPLSRTTESRGDRLSVEYERFARAESTTSLRLSLGEQAVRDGEARVWLSADYLGRAQVTGVVPEPDRVEAVRDRITYVFLAPGGGPLTIAFELKPRDWGRWRGSVGAGDAEELAISQVVYP